MAATALRVVESHARVYRSTWQSSVFTSFASPVLFLLAMGLGLGSLVDRGAGGGVEGISYVAFLAPGLMAATAMQVAATESTWPVMTGLRWHKTYQAMLATPIGAADIALGHLAWVGVRLLLAAVVFGFVMVLFGTTGVVGALLAVGPALLTGLAIAAPITAYTVRLHNDYSLSGLFRFGIIPMFLFSGTFFPLTQLPQWAQAVGVATPLWHGVELSRAAALGLEPGFHPLVHVAYLTAWLLVGAVLMVRGFRRRLVT